MNKPAVERNYIAKAMIQGLESPGARERLAKAADAYIRAQVDAAEEKDRVISGFFSACEKESNVSP